MLNSPPCVVITQTYTERLYDIGITLLEPYINAHTAILLQCQICAHEWKASPLSKMNTFKKTQTNGCPNCALTNKYGDKKQDVLDQLHKRNIQVLTPGYDGHQQQIKIRVTNLNCGHEFDIMPTNLIHRKVNCPVCIGKQIK